MITYEMIEAKIDRLLKSGSPIMYDLVRQCCNIGHLYVSEYQIYFEGKNLNKYIDKYDENKNRDLYFKYEKIFNTAWQKNENDEESEIIKYLKS